MKYLPLDTIRIILMVALVIVVIDLYSKWESIDAEKPTPAFDPFATADGFALPDAATPESATGTATPDIYAVPGAPSLSDTTTSGVPDITISVEPPAAAAGIDVPDVRLEESLGGAGAGSSLDPRSAVDSLIAVETDLMRLGISKTGGQIVYITLKKHPIALDKPEQGYILLSPELANYQAVQSGFISRSGEAPSHHGLYRLDGSVRSQDDGRITIVPLLYVSDTMRVRKHIHIDNQSYIVRESYTLDNTGTANVSLRPYTQVSAAARQTGQAFTASYSGGGYYREQDGYRKLDYDTFANKPLSLDVTDGWLAMIEHYFITAMVPPVQQSWHYYTKTISASGRTRYLIGMYGQTLTLVPSTQANVEFNYYIGPKHHDKLSDAHSELNQTIDYGILSFMSKPMFWLLDLFHSWTGNWGWAIILLTMVVRLLLYKPAEISFRSMARMREATPDIQRVRELHKGNREQMGVQMMEIYKKRKINPLSGCLPILLQIPVFIALYWMLLESIELRQTPWILWIDDLSSPDPWYVLPVLMGGFMVLQQKLNPAPLDPVQQKVFAAMPVILGAVSLFFPSGLVLYWTVNNALSIFQQWIINKRVHEQELRRHN
ncbi:MAG: membrane protein insertase YidC [Gammaproteobacteria bacterium]|nr:membrane protein insertase YidC [Pseudomonadota bacterium]MCH9662275.1 membrane protein insertase YidC [Gammaproteobacteria bacterium]